MEKKDWEVAEEELSLLCKRFQVIFPVNGSCDTTTMHRMLDNLDT